jgi:hypothetical protein
MNLVEQLIDRYLSEMVIKAKYPGVCPKCGGIINKGDRIEWTRGSKPTHVVCPASPVKPVSRGAGYGTVFTSSHKNATQICAKCKQPIGLGSRIRYYYDAEGNRSLEHEDCEAEKARQMALLRRPQKYSSSSGRLATPKQKAIIRRAKRDWFDIFDGATQYNIMTGPSDAEIEAMSSKEASNLISAILADRY